jgi:putative lipoprotein
MWPVSGVGHDGMNRLMLAAIVASWVMVTNCASLEGERESIRGTVAYRQKIAMPPDAVVVVELVDLSVNESVPPVVVSTRLTEPGSVPVSYELNYRRSLRQPGHQYAVRARIESGGRPWMVMGTVNHIMDFGRIARADVVLKPARY